MQQFVRNVNPARIGDISTQVSRVVPHLIASDLSCATRSSHVTEVSNALRKSGILKVSLQFKDDASKYLQNLILCLHKHHGHGLPITHSASRGWFWDIRPNSTTFQTPSHQARSETMQEFPWHTDCSYEEAPPKYFALQVLREDRCGGGTLSVMNVGKLSSMLSPSTWAALLRPQFRIDVPPEFVKNDASRHIIGSLMAADSSGAPNMLRFREDIMTPLNVEAAAALVELKDRLLGLEVQAETLHLTPDCLPRGSVVLMDNRRWLHARNEVMDPERHLRRVRWDARPFPAMTIIKTRDASVPHTSDRGPTESRGSTEKLQEEDPNKPSCCKDKPSPCCDVSCLDRIALRECHKEQILSSNEASPKLPTPSCQTPDGKPCEQHRLSARTRYLARLEALGCICRALIALGQESCCAPPRRFSLGKDRRSANSCCAGGITRPKTHHSASIEGRGESCSSGCCGSPKAPTVVKQCPSTSKGKAADSGSSCSKPETPESTGGHTSVTNGEFRNIITYSKGCCDKPNMFLVPTAEQCSSPEKGNSCRRACSPSCRSKSKRASSAWSGEKPDKPACSSPCGSKPEVPSNTFPGAKPVRPEPGTRSTGCCGKPVTSPCTSTEETPTDFIEVIPGTATPDLEKGFTGQEHVVLSISGMTCTGCETKLKRTLGTLQSVQSLKTSLLLSRAELDLDVSAQSFDEVLKYLERTTEFKYERATDRGFRLDVIVPNASEFMKQAWPRGVTEMTLVDDGIIGVSFDARIIGARDLVEHGWGSPLSLASPRPDPTLQAGVKHGIAYGSASLALATIVQTVIAGPFYPKALKALIFSRIIEMDLLIVLSTSAAYVFSVVSFGYVIAGQRLSTGEFFETSTLLVTLIMVGRYFAALARQKAVESISLRSLQAPTAILTDDSAANEKEIDVRLLQYGDIFKVAPDSQIPTDGTVIGGSSEVDESMITGESIPVDKSLGSAVVAGSVNGSGILIVKLTRLPVDNTISIIAGMVDQAKLSKAKVQDIADRVASYFVPVIVALTIITFVIWIAVGIAVRKQSGSRATTEAITYAITVLIVSCPCAIGLAVPMVIVIASGVAAERGIIFKGADSIELACKASHVVFDKTGTLTQGKLTFAIEHIDNASNTMSLLLGLVGSNKHPISAAVTAHLKAKGISPSTVPDTKLLTGKGVEGFAPGLILRAGNSRWLNLSSDPLVRSILEKGYTAFCFTINDNLAAVFGLEDSLRPDAREIVTKLQERGIFVHLLSGDDDGAVRSVARQLGIPAQNIRSRCTPGDKQAYIQALHNPLDQGSHKTRPTTIFVGDGTNDAVALATSTIGVHMNQETGTDVAKSAADVVLMLPSLLSILTMINISKKAVWRIKFNFGWSFVYNLFAILLGAGAFVDARIPPEFAGLGELVSVLPVVFAAVLLRWARV